VARFEIYASIKIPVQSAITSSWLFAYDARRFENAHTRNAAAAQRLSIHATTEWPVARAGNPVPLRRQSLFGADSGQPSDRSALSRRHLSVGAVAGPEGADLTAAVTRAAPLMCAPQAHSR
jgi:hypothetical protein